MLTSKWKNVHTTIPQDFTQKQEPQFQTAGSTIRNIQENKRAFPSSCQKEPKQEEEEPNLNQLNQQKKPKKKSMKTHSLSRKQPKGDWTKTSKPGTSDKKP